MEQEFVIKQGALDVLLEAFNQLHEGTTGQVLLAFIKANVKVVEEQGKDLEKE